MTYESDPRIGTHPEAVEIAEAYIKHGNYALRHVLSNFNDPDLAEEALQDGAVRMLVHGLPEDNEVPLVAALDRHTQLAAINRLRRSSSSHERDQKYFAKSGDDVDTSPEGIDTVLMHVALEGPVAALKRAIIKLSVIHQEVLVLEMQGLTNSEIADNLGVPIGTVKSRLSMAKGGLESEMRKKYPNGLDEVV